jgi:hypothetical protein
MSFSSGFEFLRFYTTRVISDCLTVGQPRLVYPQLRTCRCTALTGAEGHFRTHAPQQLGLLDHLVREREQPGRNGQPQSSGRL